MKQTLKFEVELDENNLPNSIKMLEEKASNSSIDLKALMIAGLVLVLRFGINLEYVGGTLMSVCD
mgnify:CR=1 FL=1